MPCSETKARAGKYSNDLAEQDRRRVKQSIYPTPGFKNFKSAAVTIGGVELVQRIREGQFDTSVVIVREGATVSQVGEAVLPV